MSPFNLTGALDKSPFNVASIPPLGRAVPLLRPRGIAKAPTVLGVRSDRRRPMMIPYRLCVTDQRWGAAEMLKGLPDASPY